MMNRREFLKSLALVAAAAAAGRWLTIPVQASRRRSRNAANRVVHVRSSHASTWNYATGWYGDYVDQPVVNTATDLGVMALTDTATLADAWRSILPDYTTGQKVAIKINLNNATCGSSHNVIDALPQPVNAVIRGLKAIGVAENNILVYDCTHGWHNGEMPTRVVNKISALYPDVQFHSNQGSCSTALGFSASQKVTFNVPPGKPAISSRPIANALVNSDYLINMPIMKKHGMAGVTLGFKNHFGSLDECYRVHWTVTLADGSYTPAYNGLVDIMNNPHFKNKTVLTIGDAIYGAKINNYNEVPSPWASFENQSPNSLFFSRDPVAVDCVMCDFLSLEGGIPAHSDDHLKLAGTAGMGTYERWDAGKQYNLIDYRYYDLDTYPRVYLPLITRDWRESIVPDPFPLKK